MNGLLSFSLFFFKGKHNFIAINYKITKVDKMAGYINDKLGVIQYISAIEFGHIVQGV